MSIQRPMHPLPGPMGLDLPTRSDEEPVASQTDTSPIIVSRKGTSGVGRKDLQCGAGLGGS